jgi:glutathione S-transferase
MPEEVRRDNDRINNEAGLDSPLLPGALRRFKQMFGDIERTLANSPWLVGDSYSLADISMVVYANRLETFQLSGLLNELPNLTAWLARIKQRPSFAEAVVKWGDTSSPARMRHGKEAFPKVKALWDAA